MSQDATAIGRTIPADKMTPDSLTPNAYYDFLDWRTDLVSGRLGQNRSAMKLFCIFTDVLPAQDHVAYRSVEIGSFDREQMAEMVIAGSIIMNAVLEWQNAEIAKAEAAGNAEAAEAPKKRTRSKKSKPTGTEPA